MRSGSVDTQQTDTDISLQGQGKLVAPSSALVFISLFLTRTMSPTETPNVQPSDDSVPRHPTFTTANLAALLSSGLAQGYSNNERQAVARALLRHDAHLDGTHYLTRTLNGLHPSFVGFNPTPLPDEAAQSKRELVGASLKDVFDAVSLNLSIL